MKKNIVDKNDLLLLLSHHPKIGAQTIKKVLKIYDNNSQDIDRINVQFLASHLGEKIANYVRESRELSLDKIHDMLIKNNIGYITMYDKSYPKLLKEIPDCPAILYVKGDITILNKNSISIVGSRKFTPYGARVAKKFAKIFALNKIPVVSGLALGIDSMAHQAVVETEGETVAVLGSGLDKIYPNSNVYLADRIIKMSGAIISEYPPGTEPFKSNFPSRNRIIAGMTLGSLIVEAAKESGALITAMAALDYNRDVYAIPGPIDSPSSEGTNWLIQQGAKLVVTPQDVLDDLNIDAKNMELIAKEYTAANDEERLILKLVENNYLCSDDIVRKSKMNIAVASYALTMLEMKGILENVGGVWKKKL